MDAMYDVTESTSVQYGRERTVYTVVRTDGTPAGFGSGQDGRIYRAEYPTREGAEFYAEFYGRTPAGYDVKRETPRAGSIDRTPRWVLTGGTDGDPSPLRVALALDWTAEGTAWPAGTRPVDVLIKRANDHAAGAAARISKKAETDAVEAAEATVREARAEQLAAAQAAKGELATGRQVDYILQLLAAAS